MSAAHPMFRLLLARPELLVVPALPLLVGTWAWWRLARTEQPGSEAWAGRSRPLSADLTLIRDTPPAP